MDNNMQRENRLTETTTTPASGNSAAETRGSNAAPPPPPCFVVGLGASAGGQEALEQIFATMPTDCSLSFVVVMHLPPGAPSFLDGMLGRLTPMPVVTAEDGMPLQQDRVHVIPSGSDLFIADGLIRLAEPEPGKTHHPIDRLFRSLAAELGSRAVAVVLSGYGMDGSEGVKAVREAGGIVIVQEPASSVSTHMPKNAIATGAVDFVLPAGEIPAKIAEIAHGQCPLSPRTCQVSSLDNELAAIFSIVKSRTGNDFSSYKQNTVIRRIERRMAVNEVGGIGKYIAFLRESPKEATALAQDILIGVTSFFRDPEAFETLRATVIPRIFAGRNADEPIRIWHACCATGEEVYSMAMLIREYLNEHRISIPVQFFATDIDETAIAQARAGLYSDDIAAEVGEERLKTFFTRMNGRWQVSKQLREMIVFAHHSVIKDPPFSKLDLLVCRNFLIYLNPDMQKRLMALFHMVLKPGAILFLGASETVGRHSDLFVPLDKKWKIFERPEGGRRDEVLLPFASSVRRIPGVTRSRQPAGTEEPDAGAIAERLLMLRYAPPCVVVNEKYEVVHVSTKMGRFLEIPLGEPTRDILRMAREELRPALRSAIYRTFSEQKPVAFRGVKVVIDSEESTVNVMVEPLTTAADTLALVFLEQAAAPATETPVGQAGRPDDEASRDQLVRQLEEQLNITHEQLQATSEQLETSHEGFMAANEELMSINEEFQSANEELQSTNEELETSKEELQALNEELVTVNAELQGKVEELDQANSDMENLLASSEIATLFLDRQFTIKRFSPAMAQVLNLIPADVGRPFRHLAGTIDWSDLPGDAAMVLEKLTPVEREVTAVEDSRSFLMRILPYRTTEGKVDGVVVTLIDISHRKRMEQQTVHLASFPQLNPNPVLEVDLTGRVTFCNPATLKIAEELGIGASAEAFIPPDLYDFLGNWDRKGDATLQREIELKGRVFGESIFLTSQFGVARIYSLDITERKKAERARARLAAIVESSDDAIIAKDLDGLITNWNRGAERLFDYPAQEVIGKPISLLIPSEQQEEDARILQRLLAGGRIDHYETVRLARGGRRIDVSVTVSPIKSEGRIIGASKIVRDITERKRAENEREITIEFLRLANESTATRDLIEAAIGFFQEKSGCEAVGIRVKEGDDYPYYEARGFSNEFILLENELCSRDETGDIIRDCSGNPLLECMCGNVICERFDPAKPFFTTHGSFWSNCTTELLASTAEADRQARTRNRCNGEGYESVALIPLHFAGERLGLLQLNDRRTGMFTAERIALWERLTGYLAVALAKFRTEEELRKIKQRNEFLANILEVSSQPFAVGYPDGQLGLVNSAYERLTGYSADELRAMDWTKTLTPPEWLEVEQQKLEELLNSGRPLRYEKEYIRKDGTRVPVELLVHLATDAEGRPEYYHAFVTDISERKRAEDALRESESRVRRKLESIITPKGDIGALDLADIIDVPSLQSLVDDFYTLSGIPMGLIDIKGKVLAGVGWQPICTNFHRLHPETCKNCIESDTILTEGVPPGEYRLYKCRNNLWDVATPIMVDERHFGNLFIGQFFFDEEQPDHDFFRSQARQYGFDEKEYLAALEAVPRFSRATLDTSMHFFMKLAGILSKQSYSNLKLARSLTERDALTDSLRANNEELSRFNDASVGRELRMIELKKEINALCCKAGLPLRYQLDSDEEQP